MTRDELIDEIAKERYLPVLPPPLGATPKARQVRRAAQPSTGKTKRRPTGTGWPA